MKPTRTLLMFAVAGFAVLLGCAAPADRPASKETAQPDKGADARNAAGPLLFKDAMEQMEQTGFEDDVLLPPDLEDSAPTDFLAVIERAGDLLQRAVPDPEKTSPEFERLLETARSRTRRLTEAARAGNLDAFHDARDALYQTCIDCHDRFRDEKGGE